MSETIGRLGAEGVEVEVLAPSYRGLRSHVVRGVTVHRFRYAPSRFETLTHDQTTPDRIRERPLYLSLVPSYLVSGTLAAIRLARSGRYDVMHAFWPLPHGLMALVARRFSGVPVVATFFGVELTWVRRQLPFLAPLVRWIVHRSDAVTVISRHTAGEVEAMAPGVELEVVPFGAAVRPGEGAGEPSLPRTGGPYRVLFVGRLVERKGVDVLLRATALLGEGEVRVRVVGEGPERAGLEALARELGVEDRVDFTGSLDEAALSREFAACDVFVLPAVRDSKGDVEGLGVVLIEALGHGKPVIASRSGGIVDIVRDDWTGLLVPPGDAAALAAAVDRLRTHPEQAARLAAVGQAEVRERFSWTRIVADLVGLYRRVAGGRAEG